LNSNGGCMKRFKNIIFIFDPTIDQQVAVEHAKSLARENIARITIFSVVKAIPDNKDLISTVISPEELLSIAINAHQEKLDELVTEMKQQGIEATAKIMTGTPFIEIICQVLREKHDLVIIAAEGKSGLKERLLGSTSMHLMRKCPCPVWIVKQTQNTKYERILAAVDVSVEAPDTKQESLNPLILQLASSMALREDSEFHVVQVWSMFGEVYMEFRGDLSEKSIQNASKELRHQYSSKLKKLLAKIALKDIDVHEHLLKNDDIPATIIDLARDYKIDLLVMGTVCRTGIAGFFIGNTAEKVLSEINCSILTVKPHDFVTPIMLEEE